MRKHERKNVVFVGFMGLWKVYDRVNKEALLLTMYDMDAKLLNEIKRRYVNSRVCVILKLGENECFRIDSGVRHRYMISPWLFNVYMNAARRDMKMGMRRMGVRFLE